MSSSLLPSGSELMQLDGVSRLRGSDSGEEVSSPKKRFWPCLAINFSSEVLSWFIDDFSEETSSSISSSESPEESSPPSSSESLLLHLMLVVVVVEGYCWRRESVEMERVISWMRESDRPLHFI
jgi:hypothetical protein